MVKTNSTCEKNNLQQESAYLKQIIKIQSLLGQADFNLNAFMLLVVEQVQQLTGATGVVVELVEGDEMVYRAATGSIAGHLNLRLSIHNSISGLCIKKNKVLSSEDTEQDERVDIEACRKVQARSLVVAPLVYESKPIGVLKILSNKPYAFSANNIQTLQVMAGFIASGLAHQILYEANQQILKERTEALNELRKLQKKLYYLANHDNLTQLTNRKSFNEILKMALSYAKNQHYLLALMYLDIDHFKSINDTYGHAIGDELLKAFCARVKRSIRQDDVFARLGGDEFIILIEKMTSQQDATFIASKIIKIISNPFKFNDLILSISTSIGIAFYQGEDISAHELIANADDALYQAKKAGRSGFKVFNN
ncbi:diguanylate cyclase domain-containing protein [Legionella sp. D16C41]|uniref:diguanylate cyclase domain-containing protein n=1 Tax=Legionella sp. D16C41 TaxID=3402688 RepID=UPI003AF94F33